MYRFLQPKVHIVYISEQQWKEGGWADPNFLLSQFGVFMNMNMNFFMSFDVESVNSLDYNQGPIIQVLPSGWITLLSDIIGPKDGSVQYDSTIVFPDLVMKL